MSGYIRGRYATAACDLIDRLKTLGVSAQVGYQTRGKNRTLLVYVLDGPIESVPAEFAGLPTKIMPHTD